MKLNCGVVGLSDGVYSCTTAARINRTFAEYNRQDAQALAKAQGIRYEIHSFEKLVEAFKLNQFRY